MKKGLKSEEEKIIFNTLNEILGTLLVRAEMEKEKEKEKGRAVVACVAKPG